MIIGRCLRDCYIQGKEKKANNKETHLDTGEEERKISQALLTEVGRDRA